MILYLLKASLCSALLLSLYELVLAKEKMYRFNRFYLLFGLVFSIFVPLIDIELAQTQLPQPIETIYYSPENTPSSLMSDGITSSDAIVEISSTSNEISRWLWFLYGCGCVLLLLRFSKNIYALLRSINSKQTIDYQDIKIVLIDTKIAPHSFWNLIFVNKADYENGVIKQEILCHELTHIKQKHSLDVLFVELLTVVAWFNPALYFYRKAIVLNHEFLADESVVNTYQNAIAYQYLLLNTIQSNSLQFASPFNYLITKKRLVMMNKPTNSAGALIAQMSVLPLLATAIFMFSHITIAQQAKPTAAQQATTQTRLDSSATPTMLEEFDAIARKYFVKISKKSYRLDQPSAADQARLETIFKAMSENQKAKSEFVLFPPLVLPRLAPTKEAFESYKNPKIYGVWLNEKKVSNEVLNQYKASDIAQVFASKLYRNAQRTIGFKYKFQVNMMTTAYYEEYKKKALADNRYVLMYNSRKRKS